MSRDRTTRTIVLVLCALVAAPAAYAAHEFHFLGWGCGFDEDKWAAGGGERVEEAEALVDCDGLNGKTATEVARMLGSGSSFEPPKRPPASLSFQVTSGRAPYGAEYGAGGRAESRVRLDVEFDQATGRAVDASLEDDVSIVGD